MDTIRSPVCSVIGHVDHGKSSILDKIRGTAIVASEAGKITQAIGASIIPIDVIKKVSGPLLEKLKMKFTIPGLLFIDTPGHAAFVNLRKRGGSLADIAILVVDINEGFKPQTRECIDILKQYKTPFVVSANKIDLISGWQDKEGSLLEVIKQQGESVQKKLDTKLYEIVGKLSELGFNSERFDRVSDYTKEIAIIPTSAKTGSGLPELLMVITGLAQRFLEKCLECNVAGFAKGTILEVKEEKGKGKTLDVIVYDGCLKVNDMIVIGGVEKPIVTKVRALFEPAALAEMRDKKSKFKPVKEVKAATGVKIAAPNVEEAVAGMPIRSSDEANLEAIKKEVQSIVEEVLIETEKNGIIIKADSLGSLEALTHLLQEKNIPIRKGSIGNIIKKDMSDAESNYEEDPLLAVILGFNVKTEAEAPEHVKVITSDIIYKIIENFEKWQEEEKKRQEAGELDTLVRGVKIEIMRGYVFRQNNPAIVGVDVLAGILKTNTPLMKDGRELTKVKSMQHEQENIEKAERGKQVAVSLPGVTIGRQIHEGDILYSCIPEKDFRKIKGLKKYLKQGEIEVLKEIASIMRKDNPTWGI